MPDEEMVIFTRMFDLLDWLLPRAETFPKAQRFILTQRLTDAALDCVACLYDANAHRDAYRLEKLRQANAELNKLRLYLRLVHRAGWLSDGQYQHVSTMVAEVGRLLGGWLRQTEKGRT